MTSPNDHRACEIRHRELLDRLEAVTGRVRELERDRRSIVDLLREFRTLIRLLAARLRMLDERIGEIASWRIPFQERSARITRHFRN